MRHASLKTIGTAAIVVCATVPFLPSLDNRLALDDHLLIAANPRIEDPSDPHAIWLTDWWFAAGVHALSPDRDLLYRPLVVQIFAWIHAFAGTWTLPYHLLNLVGHTLAALSVAVLTLRLFRRGWLAALTGIVFAVHPLHSEAVISLVGLAEVLSTLFLCLGLLAFLLSEDAPRRWWRRPLKLAGAFYFLLALLSKEQGLTFVVLLPLCLWWDLRQKRTAGSARPPPVAGHFPPLLRLVATWLVVAASVLAVYLPLRYVALEDRLITPGPPSMMSNALSVAGSSQYAWTLLAIAGEYLRLAFWPARLSCDYSYAAVPLADSPADPRVRWALAAGAALAAWSIASLRRQRVGLFITVFLVGTYALPSNAVVLLRTMVSERLFYLPLLPLTWAVLFPICRAAGWIARLGLPGRVGDLLAGGAVLAFVLPSAVQDVLRCADWQDNDALILADSRTNPRCARLQLKLGQVYALYGQWREGREAIARALAIAPEYIEAHVQMLGHYNRFGLLDESWKEFEYLLTTLGPVPPFVLQQVALRKVHDGTFDRAPATTRAASAPLDGGDAHPDQEAIFAAIRSGRLEEAAARLRATLGEDPSRIAERRLLARLLVLAGQIDTAGDEYALVLEQSPDEAEALAAVAMISAPIAPEVAVNLAVRAAELVPDDDLVQLGAASVLFFAGYRQESAELLVGLARSLPQDHPTRRLVVKLLPPNAPI